MQGEDPRKTDGKCQHQDTGASLVVSKTSKGPGGSREPGQSGRGRAGGEAQTEEGLGAISALHRRVMNYHRLSSFR